LKTEPQAELDYVSVADPQRKVECARVNAAAFASIALHVDATLLSDNTILDGSRVACG